MALESMLVCERVRQGCSQRACSWGGECGGGAVGASVQASVPAGPQKGPRWPRGGAEENQAAGLRGLRPEAEDLESPRQRDLLSTDLNLPSWRGSRYLEGSRWVRRNEKQRRERAAQIIG